MSTSQAKSSRWPQAQRVLGGVATLSLLLPMMTVKSCNGSTVETWTGVGFYTQDVPNIVGLVVVLAAAGVSVGWPVVRDAVIPRQLARAGLVTALCSAALAVTLMLPVLSFLFDDVRPELGWVIQGVCWASLSLGGVIATIVAARRIESWEGGARLELVLAGLVLLGPLVPTLLSGDWKIGALVMVVVVVLGVAGPLALGLIGVGLLVTSGAPDTLRWRIAGVVLSLCWLGLWVLAVLG